MGQISMEKSGLSGSVLSGNQQRPTRRVHRCARVSSMCSVIKQWPRAVSLFARSALSARGRKSGCKISSTTCGASSVSNGWRRGKPCVANRPAGDMAIQTIAQGSGRRQHRSDRKLREPVKRLRYLPKALITPRVLFFRGTHYHDFPPPWHLRKANDVTSKMPEIVGKYSRCLPPEPHQNRGHIGRFRRWRTPSSASKYSVAHECSKQSDKVADLSERSRDRSIVLADRIEDIQL